MLELKQIGKSFDGVPVLKDISIRVEDGEIVSILGPSGCGKTTLLNIILGILDADAGQILYNGEDLTRTPMEKRGFNIVFQDYALFPNLNVRQNITYGLRNKPGISTDAEVQDMISLLGLGDHLNKRIDQLSGGQKQRVALARTLVMKPRILLLDEPLSALDGVIKESIKERIQTIAKEFHLTTLIVTHDPEEALTLSDRVLIIENGCISQYARPEEIVRLTGIDDSMVQDAPGMEEILDQVLDFMEDLPLLGHQVIFDYGFLVQAAVNQNRTLDKEGIDTLKLCRLLMPAEEKKNLGAACRYFGIEQEKAHRALSDAISAHLLYQKLMEVCGTGREDLFSAKKLQYRAKKERTATKRQKEHLQDLLKYHRINVTVQVEHMSGNEISRMIDRIIFTYGRIPGTLRETKQTPDK